MILRTAVIIAMVFSFSFYIGEVKEKSLNEKDLLKAKIDYRKEEEKTLKEIATIFLGTPYKRSPLSEKDKILYRTDFFDCTTFVLSVTAEKNTKEKTPEEIMLEINYYPPGSVSYNNRNHFSTYRNKISPYFEDITKNIGESYLKENKVILNKKKNGKRIINIDWEEEIVIHYIQAKDIEKIINNIPQEVGVGFINTSRFEDGLDIVHEGLLFDRDVLIHASSKEGRVVQEKFLEYLTESNHSGVLFYKIN